MDDCKQMISSKVDAGERLTLEDGLYLYAQDDLLWLGQLALKKKRAISGNQVFFNVNHHINLTNICKSLCRFCAFGRKADADGAYVMNMDRVKREAAVARANGATEFHVVSAMHPELPFSYYLQVLQYFKESYPDIYIQAFTAVEIFNFAQTSGLSLTATLQQLIAAGLDSIPGGGAEILDDDLRRWLCPHKANSEEWLRVHRIAHRLGLKTNATMLYGHIESVEQRVGHLLKLRALQDEYQGFQAFIPLPFLPENTRMDYIKRTSAIDDIKTMAIARLLLDNFPHIKAFWIMLGIDVAQLALNFGADDLDGTVHEEKIMHAAGAETARGMQKSEIIDIIKITGFQPVERDTLYNVIKYY